MMAVEFTPGPPPRVGKARLLFEFDTGNLIGLVSGGGREYDVSRDGRRFYALEVKKLPERPVVTHINLIENWFEELKALR
jgi:hypothetical protein